MRDSVIHSVSSFLRTIRSRGGETTDLLLDRPATEAELGEVEAALGRPLPMDLRRFAAAVSKRVAFQWRLPDGYQLPAALRQIFGGGLDYDISKIPQHEEGRASWQAECFPNPENPYDAVWHGKLAFHGVPNGDYLAFDPAGRVVYLSHDDGEGHGYIMASSFTDLLTRWTPLGCPGPEDWQWLPFVSDARSGIDPASENARQWLARLAKQFNE